jgi:hypothetical protein
VSTETQDHYRVAFRLHGEREVHAGSFFHVQTTTARDARKRARYWLAQAYPMARVAWVDVLGTDGLWYNVDHT